MKHHIQYKSVVTIVEKQQQQASIPNNRTCMLLFSKIIKSHAEFIKQFLVSVTLYRALFMDVM